MNTTALLALISNLYAQVLQLETQNAELQKALATKED